MTDEFTTMDEYCKALRIAVETQPDSFMAQWFYAITTWHAEQSRIERELRRKK